MKTSTSEGKHGIQWTARIHPDDLNFVDDLAYLSYTQQQMQEKTTSVAEASETLGSSDPESNSNLIRTSRYPNKVMKTNDGLLFMKRPENPKQITERKKVDLENGEHNYSKNFDRTLTKEQEEDATSFSSKLLEHKSELESRLLTREDLINLDKIEPRWRYIRLGLLIGFGIIFFGLLAACIVYIIVGEKCPSVPKLPFWKSTVGYWLDVFAFKDSSGDLVGDLNGLTSEVDYIKTVVGAGYVILGPITKGFYTNSYNMLGLVEDYKQLDEAVGTMDDFRVLLKRFHKNGIKVVLTFNFNAISINHKWISENEVKLNLFENSPNNSVKLLSFFHNILIIYFT
ncbi:unnamed protein product [Schistosoma mattheei]|uniref:Uncharacterized protein n=1 Tax=Schistosoma mattheei TaxID=31246 RepID=A0A183NKP9_9TREM|nr:unnamed protein product [Schistosoma mattheei]